MKCDIKKLKRKVKGVAIGEPNVLCVYLMYATRVIIIKILTR